ACSLLSQLSSEPPESAYLYPPCQSQHCSFTCIIPLPAITLMVGICAHRASSLFLRWRSQVSNFFLNQLHL
ncbi:mCG1046409, partial [Mus musculus]